MKRKLRVAPPERANQLANLFWAQMARIRPESYVADNDYLTFVSMNEDLFLTVRNAVKALGEILPIHSQKHK